MDKEFRDNNSHENVSAGKIARFLPPYDEIGFRVQHRSQISALEFQHEQMVHSRIGGSLINIQMEPRRLVESGFLWSISGWNFVGQYQIGLLGIRN